MRGGKIVDWDPDVVDREYLDSGKPLVNIPLKSLKFKFFILQVLLFGDNISCDFTIYMSWHYNNRYLIML